MVRDRRRRSYSQSNSIVLTLQLARDPVQQTIHQESTSDLIRKIWGAYLKDTVRYDSWGALGKLLVVRETLAREGFTASDLSRCGAELQRLVNLVFPRTFVMESDLPATPGTPSRILAYYRETCRLLLQQGMDDVTAGRHALDETAAKFSCRPVDVREHLPGSPPPISACSI